MLRLCSIQPQTEHNLMQEIATSPGNPSSVHVTMTEPTDEIAKDIERTAEGVIGIEGIATVAEIEVDARKMQMGKRRLRVPEAKRAA